MIRASRPAALARAALICIATCAVAPAPAQAPAREDGLRASSALRLATLAERIAKLNAQIGQGVLAERSRRALPEAIRDFDATLRAAHARSPTAEIRDNYVLLALLWREYRDWAMRAPSREHARKLRERCEEVVWVASRGARMLQERSRAAESGWALRAAGAATLSQRIPKLYLWRRWDMRDAALARELREAEENLQRALEELRAAPADAAVAGEIQAAESQFRFMADAARQVERAQAPARHIEFIAKTGDHILEAMERLSRLFERAS